MSIRDRLIAAFDARGATRLPTRSTKFVVYAYNGETYYIGKAGALRWGSCLTRSLPVSDVTKACLLNADFSAEAAVKAYEDAHLRVPPSLVRLLHPTRCDQ